MPRSPVSDSARNVKLSIRVTPDEGTLIDRLRGAHSVSDYLRALVQADARRRRAASTKE